MTSFGFCVQWVATRNIGQCCTCGSFHKLLQMPLQTKNTQISTFQNIIIIILKVILLIGFKKILIELSGLHYHCSPFQCKSWTLRLFSDRSCRALFATYFTIFLLYVLAQCESRQAKRSAGQRETCYRAVLAGCCCTELCDNTSEIAIVGCL